jgi:hypothetical protein
MHRNGAPLLQAAPTGFLELPPRHIETPLCAWVSPYPESLTNRSAGRMNTGEYAYPHKSRTKK